MEGRAFAKPLLLSDQSTKHKEQMAHEPKAHQEHGRKYSIPAEMGKGKEVSVCCSDLRPSIPSPAFNTPILLWFR